MNEFHNILDNAVLAVDERRTQPIHVAGDDPQFIYSATGWMDTYVAETRADSLDEIPQSTNVPSVVPEAGLLTIRASYKAFLARFTKQAVPLKANQKYLLKLSAWPKLRFHGGGDLSTVRVRAIIEYRNQRFPLQWQSFSAWMAEAPQELAWPITCYENVTVNVSFEIWSVWGNVVGDIALQKLEMLEVPWAWTGSVLDIGNPVVVTPTPETPANNVLTWLLAGGLGLAILVVLLLLLRSAPVSAQAVPVGTPMTPEQAATAIITVVLTFLLSFAQSLPVQAIVNFLKAVLPLLRIHVRAEYILVAVSGLVTILTYVAPRLGVELRLQSVYDWLILILPPLTNFIVMLAGAKGFYALFKWTGLPLFGYQRSA